MKIQAAASYSFKSLFFSLLILAGRALSDDQKCPFKYVYHFGDGVTDTGNSIHVLSWETNPASHWPYGISHPGWPTGRWSDGLVDFDYAAEDFGIKIVPYLESCSATKSDGVIFSVARSPVLPHVFFWSKGIKIPFYTVSLEGQMNWFRTYLKRVCYSPQGCAERLNNSLVLMGDIEGNDIGYALTQGKSIDEVKTYVPLIIKSMIDASREIILLGASRLIIPGNGPLGCYPYILTAFHTRDPTAYDELGCLKSVNDLVVSKNAYLQEAIESLKEEFPNTLIYYGPMYNGVRQIINETSVVGPDGINKALKSCCGIGGKYKFDKKRFCGSSGVPVCTNPDDHIYWDGLHLTQEASRRMEKLLVKPALDKLGCKPILDQSYGESSLSALF